MNTLKINVPEGFKIDKDKSTFEEIVFKPIEKWEDLGRIIGWYVSNDGVIYYSDEVGQNSSDVFATKEQAKAAIALAKLSQLREVYRQGWKPDWKDSEMKHSITKLDGVIFRNVLYRSSHFLAFQSEEVRNEFLKNFKDLIEEASPLLFG